jgi:superfamily I DNA/RNA helicase
MKIFGVDMLTAAIRTFNALWPGVPAPKSVRGLVDYLMESEDQLNEWRESAARAGADEALAFVLSWYEGIKLETLQSMRTGSKWTTDPELIQQLKERAHSFVQYADIHNFIADLNEPADEGEDDEDEENAEDDSEAEILDAGITAPSRSGMA